MEMFFRKIEYWIEGDAGEQRRLDHSPWTTRKIRIKALKHGVFFAISMVAANFFLAYIIGMDEVIKLIREPLSLHFGGFLSMLVFSGAFYMIFARLREQVCTTICPYGRLQSVLLVNESIVVAYDHLRGEPRSKRKKNTGMPEAVAYGALAPNSSHEHSGHSIAQPNAILGDCVDCSLCVRVCPTGIDIRNGTQMECTNCTACIDACDSIMDKVGFPRGLIRYDSMKGIATGKRKLMTTRVLAYSGVLIALIMLDIFLIAKRGIVETIILRSPGQLYQQKDDTHLTNLYSYILVNKTTKEMPIQLRAATAGADIQMVGTMPATINKNSRIEGAFFVEMPIDQLKGRKTPIKIEVISYGRKIDEITTNFMGPVINDK